MTQRFPFRLEFEHDAVVTLLAQLDERVCAEGATAAVFTNLTLEDAALLHSHTVRKDNVDPRSNMIWHTRTPNIRRYVDYENLNQLLELMKEGLFELWDESEDPPALITHSAELSDRQYCEAMQWVGENMVELEDALSPSDVTWPAALRLPKERDKLVQTAQRLGLIKDMEEGE